MCLKIVIDLPTRDLCVTGNTDQDSSLETSAEPWSNGRANNVVRTCFLFHFRFQCILFSRKKKKSTFENNLCSLYTSENLENKGSCSNCSSLPELVTGTL